MVNRFGQEVRVGDFILYATSRSGHMSMYVVIKITELPRWPNMTDPRYMDQRVCKAKVTEFTAKTWRYNRETQLGETIDPPEAGANNTIIGDLLECYVLPGLPMNTEPVVAEAYLNKRMEALTALEKELENGTA